MANNLKINSTKATLSSDASAFFNNYLQPTFSVSQDINNAVISQFEKITNNTESAKILASAVIYTSLAQRINPMEVIDRISTMNVQESISYLSLFLNLNRVGTSFLGVHNAPKVGKYILRMIRP